MKFKNSWLRQRTVCLLCNKHTAPTKWFVRCLAVNHVLLVEIKIPRHSIFKTSKNMTASRRWIIQTEHFSRQAVFIISSQTTPVVFITRHCVAPTTFFALFSKGHLSDNMDSTCSDGRCANMPKLDLTKFDTALIPDAFFWDARGIGVRVWRWNSAGSWVAATQMPILLSLHLRRDYSDSAIFQKLFYEETFLQEELAWWRCGILHNAATLSIKRKSSVMLDRHHSRQLVDLWKFTALL